MSAVTRLFLMGYGVYVRCSVSHNTHYVKSFELKICMAAADVKKTAKKLRPNPCFFAGSGLY